MKIAVARGPGTTGGIFRRFRELAAYAAGRYEMVGLLMLGADDGEIDDPVRTHVFGRGRLALELMHAAHIDEVLSGCAHIIERVAQTLETERPDFVMAVDTDLKGLCVVAACRRLGVPVTTHVASVARMDAAFDNRPSQRFMPMAERYCLEQSTRLIFPSRFAAEHCGKQVPSMAPWVVIHNGIAAAFLDAPAPRPDPKKAGAVMRLSAIKNPPALGRIAARLHHSGIAVELVTDASRIRSFPPLAAHVTLRAPIADSAELAAFYGGCRAIVCPSHFEASGNVPLEAMASGTPAVVTTGMGSAELLRALGRDDLIVEVDDVDGMVDRVMRAEPVAPAIRARLRDELSWPSVCARLVSALSQ